LKKKEKIKEKKAKIGKLKKKVILKKQFRKKQKKKRIKGKLAKKRGKTQWITVVIHSELSRFRYHCNNLILFPSVT
jgi:hypothetical protein